MDQVRLLTPAVAIIIEDEAHLADIYARALHLSEFETIIYTDGLEALDGLMKMETAPNLIILDLNLPRVTGKEILRFIRTDERYARTRVIMATSESAAVIGEIENKSDLVLLKPIGFHQLRELTSRFR